MTNKVICCYLELKNTIDHEICTYFAYSKDFWQASVTKSRKPMKNYLILLFYYLIKTAYELSKEWTLTKRSPLKYWVNSNAI